MNATNPNRQPKGQPTGGQFAAKANPEPEVELGAEPKPTKSVGPDGTERWHLNGQLHRDEGPAVIWPDGTELWYQHGQFHRGTADRRSSGLTSADLRTLDLHRSIGDKFRSNPTQVRSRARINLTKLRSADTEGRSRHYHDKWERLLAGPDEGLIWAFTSSDQAARDLRDALGPEGPSFSTLTIAVYQDHEDSWAVDDGCSGS